MITTAEALARIQSIQDCYRGSSDDVTGQWMAENLVAGKPAFCWYNTYSNQAAGLFTAEVACLGSIEAAQESMADFWANREDRDAYSAVYLDNLRPLNEAGVLDLMAAYERAGTFRDRSELDGLLAYFNPAPALQAAE